MDQSHSSSRLTYSRRRRYLELHPTYFSSASVDLELAGKSIHHPLAYDRLIRRHQSAAEREAEGKKKGWAGVLEGSLLRGEAKLAEINPEKQVDSHHGAESPLSRRTDWRVEGEECQEDADKKSKGLAEWHELLAERFIAGMDGEFDYTTVDSDESLDGDWKVREKEERWYEDEEDHLESRLGETGVQDF